MTIHWLGYMGTALVIVAYLPQISHLITERCSAGLSVRAYVMWVTSAVLLLTYAISLGDGVFIALQTYQLVATAVICFCCKKYEHSLCEDHGGAPTNQTLQLVRTATRSGSGHPILDTLA